MKKRDKRGTLKMHVSHSFGHAICCVLFVKLCEYFFYAHMFRTNLHIQLGSIRAFIYYSVFFCFLLHMNFAKNTFIKW